MKSRRSHADIRLYIDSVEICTGFYAADKRLILKLALTIGRI